MSRLIRRFQPDQIREFVTLLLIVLVLLFFGSQIDNYFSPRFFNRISTSVAIIAVVAVGQTLVFLTENFDLSVGSVVGFTAYYVGQQLSANNEMAPAVAILMAVGIGAVMGSVNGLLVAYGRVPSVIVTLGTLAIYRTILVEYSDAQTVLTSNLPEWILNLPRAGVDPAVGGWHIGGDVAAAERFDRQGEGLKRAPLAGVVVPDLQHLGLAQPDV